MKIFSYDNLVSVLTKIQTKINDVLSIANTAQSTADTNATNISTLRSSVSTNTSNISTNTEAISELNENYNNINVFARGVTFSSKYTDLDDCLDVGKYYVATGVANAPTTTVSGSLFVMQTSASNYDQIYIVAAVGTNKIYYRSYNTTSGFTSWYVLSGTAVS